MKNGFLAAFIAMIISAIGVAFCLVWMVVSIWFEIYTHKHFQWWSLGWFIISLVLFILFLLIASVQAVSEKDEANEKVLNFTKDGNLKEG